MSSNENLFAVGVGALLFAFMLCLFLIVGAIVGSLSAVILFVAGALFLVLSPFQLAWYVIKGLKRGYRG